MLLKVVFPRKTGGVVVVIGSQDLVMWRRACASVISGATAAVMYYSYAESQCSSGDRNIHDENNLPLFRFGLIADVQV